MAEREARRRAVEHLGVGAVRVDLESELALQKGGVAGVVRVAVGEQNSRELRGRQAAGAQLGEQLQPLGPVPGVNEPAVVGPAVEQVDVRHHQGAEAVEGQDDGAHASAW
jgi:hypothetical protein